MSYTIDSWCAEHDVSRSTFYKLRREGRAPRVFEVTPGCPRISAEADREWVAAREAESKAVEGV